MRHVANTTLELVIFPSLHFSVSVEYVVSMAKLEKWDTNGDSVLTWDI